MYKDQYPELDVPLLQKAYELGVFPMAEGPDVNNPILWFRPKRRAVLRPPDLHVPRRLKRFLRQRPFDLVWNDDFPAVIRACARPASGETWLNTPLIAAYTDWAKTGQAVCLSVFRDGQRVGGIYGIQQGSVFHAESMFSTVPNASSAALVALVAGLTKAGIELIDAQFRNPHTAQFGVTEMPHDHYMAEMARLKTKPVELKADYFAWDVVTSFMQSFNQTS